LFEVVQGFPRPYQPSHLLRITYRQGDQPFPEFGFFLIRVDNFRFARQNEAANDQQTLGDIAQLIWPSTSTRRLPEAFL
jgi:hypothetical protein